MVVTINGIPVYDALITDEECGMNRISLVDAPAVEADFLAFAKDKHPQMYSVSDEEKRIVRGVIMRADFPIYRRDKRRQSYDNLGRQKGYPQAQQDSRDYRKRRQEYERCQKPLHYYKRYDCSPEHHKAQ